MIRVRIKKNRQWSVEVTGHAASGPMGYDIVCAGVSALTIQLVNALTELVHLDRRQCKNRLQSGNAQILVRWDYLSPKAQQETELLIKAFGLSMQEMQKAYPEFVSYHEGGGWNG